MCTSSARLCKRAKPSCTIVQEGAQRAPSSRRNSAFRKAKSRIPSAHKCAPSGHIYVPRYGRKLRPLARRAWQAWASSRSISERGLRPLSEMLPFISHEANKISTTLIDDLRAELLPPCIYIFKNTWHNARDGKICTMGWTKVTTVVQDYHLSVVQIKLRAVLLLPCFYL